MLVVSWRRGAALAFLQNLHTVLKTSLGDKVKDLIPKLTRNLLQAGPVIGTAVSLASGSTWAALIPGTSNFVRTFFPEGETVEKTFRKLAEILDGQDRRFLVIIDDIDRLSPDVDERTDLYLAATERAALGWLVDFVSSARRDYRGRQNLPTPEEDCLVTTRALEPLTNRALAAIRAAAANGSLLHHQDLHNILNCWPFVEDEANKTLTLTYVEQPYRPLGVYKALCKSAFALLPKEELIHFTELRQWLLQSDLTTDQVYARGSHVCHTSFVQAFQPFKQPIVCLLKRNDQIDAPYMSFFIASGNVSYQIFLPCPSRDDHLRGKTITTPAFPHFYQLQPWLIPTATRTGQIDLGSPDRTEKRNGTMRWRYENKIKVA